MSGDRSLALPALDECCAQKKRREVLSIVWPFRVFGVDCSTSFVAVRRRSLVEFTARSEFSIRRSIMLMGYMIPFCRWPLPQLYGFSSTGSADCCSGNQLHPLFEFRVPPEFRSVNPSRPAAARPLLSWAFAPFSTCRHRRSTDCGCAAPTTVPSSGFGYPLDGLLPSIPGRFCFTPPALLGFTLRSRPSVGSFECFHPNGPTYRFSCRCSRRYSRVGPAGRSSWAFSPAEVPFSARGFGTFAGGDSLGFCPFQGFLPRP